MNYIVRWTRKAREQLADAWLNHPDRAAVTAAAHRIDTLLARDPENQGEERPPTRRVLFESPLVVIYRVDKTTNTVVVSNCRRY